MSRLRRFILHALLLPCFIATAIAKDVAIPDQVLRAAIWRTLGRPSPVGTLTEQDMLGLTELHANFLGVKSLEGLGAAHKLAKLYINGNQLTTLTLPVGLTSLTTLDLEDNNLTDFSFLGGLTGLTTLHLSGNQPNDFSFLSGLTSLITFDLSHSELTSLNLPDGLISLLELATYDNPLQSVVLPDPLARGRLAWWTDDLLNNGVSVRTYLLTVSLTTRPLTANGSFEFLIAGPPGTYRLEVTPDFLSWTDVGPAVNVNGSVVAADPPASSRSRGFYRAVLSN